MVSNNKIYKSDISKLLLSSPYAVAILDREQKIVDINDNFKKMFQYSLTEAKGKFISTLVSFEHHRKQVDKNVEKIYKGHGLKLEGERKRKDGSAVYVEIMGHPVIHRQMVVGVYILYIDVSEKKNNERQLHLFKKILEKNTEGVFITDKNGNVEWINNAFTDITGYTSEDLIIPKINILQSGIYSDEFNDIRNHVAYYESWKGEVWNTNKNGYTYSAWMSISSIKNEQEEITHYVGIMKDLSEKKKIDKRMIELQQKDALTGLYNRHYFLEAMERHIVSCEKFNHKFSVIAIDIDSFKDINDSLGHSVGDRLLIAVSDRMAASCTQCMISRVDGDEFALLSTLVDKNELLYFAEMMLYQLEIPYIVSNTEIYLKFNVGICLFPEDGKSSENLMRFANAAMNHSKNELSSRICFYSNNISKETEEKFYLANYLFGAITNSELTVCFQPIFEINEVRIVGAEALLRWHSPILGNIPPDRFISIAEKTGQIIVIGEWVIKEVCSQMHIWKDKGYRLFPISINLSVKQLEQPNFSKTAMDIIKSENINPGLIEFEITESVSSGDITQIVNNIKELKRNGIKISMDDFGTGFSSLGQLDIFELDKLKIDKIFIDDLVTGARRQNLVKSIIAMAKSLNLVTVAEGIETCEQLCQLKGLGCQLGQGFIFSKPLTAADIESLLYQEKKFKFTACK